MTWFCVSFDAAIADDEFWMVSGEEPMLFEEDILERDIYESCPVERAEAATWRKVEDHEMVDKLNGCMVEERAEVRRSMRMAGHYQVVALPETYCVSRKSLAEWLRNR